MKRGTLSLTESTTLSPAATSTMGVLWVITSSMAIPCQAPVTCQRLDVKAWLQSCDDASL
jgi:hypothetical protein